jgi:hypothetical protein
VRWSNSERRLLGSKLKYLLRCGGRKSLLLRMLFILLPVSHSTGELSRRLARLPPEEAAEFAFAIIPEFCRDGGQLDAGIVFDLTLCIPKPHSFAKVVHRLGIAGEKLSFQSSHCPAQGTGNRFQAQLYITVVRAKNIVHDFDRTFGATVAGAVEIGPQLPNGLDRILFYSGKLSTRFMSHMLLLTRRAAPNRIVLPPLKEVASTRPRVP